MDKPKMYDVCELCGTAYLEDMYIMICPECGNDTFEELTKAQWKKNTEENEKMKQKATHTPGPWKWEGNDLIETDGDMILVVEQYGQTYGTDGDEEADDEGTNEANRRLISTAPDLLTALVRLMGEARAAGIIPQEECMRNAEDAIRKARGE
jgi:predicted  nucleic acid-binding Zn-ribbon protein